MEYKVGQVMTSRTETIIEKALSGEKVVIPTGNKVIIGADKLAHHFNNGYIQPLADGDTVKGYDCEGVAEYLFFCLRSHLPLIEMMEDYDITEKEVKEEIEYALDEIL